MGYSTTCYYMSVQDTIADFVNSDSGKTVLSMLWGVGIATLIRPVCTSDTSECVIHKHKAVDPTWVFQNGGECMSFDSAIVPCNSDAIPVNSELDDLASPNFVLTNTDIAFLILVAVTIYGMSLAFDFLQFNITFLAFIAMLIINMYLGPTKRPVDVRPTPVTVASGVVYKNPDGTCFKYNQINHECEPDKLYLKFPV